jgi:hypothetical protein
MRGASTQGGKTLVAGSIAGGGDSLHGGVAAHTPSLLGTLKASRYVNATSRALAIGQTTH